MNIRKYSPRDREALVQVWRTVFPDDPPHNAPEKMLASKLEVDDLVFVAELDNRVIGACMAGYDGQRLAHDVSDYPRQNKRLYRNSGQPWNLVDISDVTDPKDKHES